MRTTEEPGPELDALVHETIGAAIEVHRALGPGFLESISYLKAAHKPLGLLLNFHVPVLQAGIKRVVFSAKEARTHR